MVQPRDDRGRFTADGMLNVITGLGSELRDKSRHSSFAREPDLSPYQLDAMYEQDGIAARIVDLPADDMTREGFEFEGLDDNVDVPTVESAIETLCALGSISDLDRWGAHYGGALMGVALDDGLQPWEPLDLTRIRKVHGLFVLDRHEVIPVSRKVGAPPEAYEIINFGVPIEGRLVHASRVRKFCGVDLGRRRAVQTQWWGASVMQRVWTKLRQLLSAHGYGENILHDISVDVFVLAGLADAFREGKEDLIRKRLLALNLNKDVLHAITLDAGGGPNGKAPAEQYMPQARSVAGVAELVRIFKEAVVATINIPESVFWGHTNGGMNAGENAGETRSYYASIGTRQRKRATPWLNWVLEILFASKEGPTRGNRPKAWTIRWRPLWTPTDEERADARLKTAQADHLYWEIGAASSDDISETRIVQGLHGDLVKAPEPETPEIDPAELAAGATGGNDVQATALNGAQIDGFIKLVTGITAKQMPFDVVARFLPIAFPGTIENEAAARSLLAGADTFEAPKPEPPPVAPGAHQPPPKQQPEPPLE